MGLCRHLKVPGPFLAEQAVPHLRIKLITAVPSDGHGSVASLPWPRRSCVTVADTVVFCQSVRMHSVFRN